MFLEFWNTYDRLCFFWVTLQKVHNVQTSDEWYLKQIFFFFLLLLRVGQTDGNVSAEDQNLS